MSIRWRPDIVVAALLLAACDRTVYRPVAPRAPSAANLRPVELANRRGTSRWTVTLEGEPPAGARLEGVALAEGPADQCLGTAAGSVSVDGRPAALPAPLAGAHRVEAVFEGLPILAALERGAELDVRTEAGCVRVPLSGSGPLAWRPLARWTAGAGLRWVMDRDGNQAGSFVVRGGRWLGPLRASLEAGVGLGYGGTVLGPFGAVVEVFPVRAGSVAVGLAAAYEAQIVDGATLHGPRGALIFALSPRDSPGVPRGPRLSTVSVELQAIPTFSSEGGDTVWQFAGVLITTFGL